MRKRIAFLLAFLLMVSMAFTGKNTVFAADSSETTESAAGGSLEMGSKLEDFTVNLVDGTQVKFSDILKDHKAVMINCFASWCIHCIDELPAMEEAYQKVSDDVAIIAISTDKHDTLEKLAPIKEENNLTFYVGIEPTGMFSSLTEKGYPSSLLVDRYGVICWKEDGAIKDSGKFDRLFQAFIGDDYTDSLINFEIPMQKPDAEPLSDEELTEAVNADGSQIKVENVANEFAWPFIKDDDGGVKASNSKAPESCAIMHFTVTSEKGDVLALEARTDCDPYNYLQIMIDDDNAGIITGQKDWQTWTHEFEEEGEHDVLIAFYNNMCKDQEQKASVRNLVLLSGDEAKEALSKVKTYPQTLDGDDLKIDIVSDYKKVAVKNAEEETVGYMYLLKDPNLKVHFAIGKDVDPEQVTIAASDNKSVDRKAITDLETDETGFNYSYDMSGVGDTFGVVGIQYGDVKDAYYLAASEAGLDAFCKAIGESYEQELTWAYEDGSKRAEEASPSTKSAAPASTDQGTAADAESKYELTFVDQDGKPVENVVVSVCSDSYCRMMQSDAEGRIVIENAEGAYDVHILVVPDGYEISGDGAITLDKDTRAYSFLLNKK